MVSFTKINRTRSRYRSRIGSASEDFFPSNPQMKRCMLPVRCNSDLPSGRAPVVTGFGTPQIGIDQDAAVRRVEADARLVESNHGHHRDHIRARAVLVGTLPRSARIEGCTRIHPVMRRAVHGVRV